MKCRLLPALISLTALTIFNHQIPTASAQGTAFTYQGRLNDGANPANGIYDLRFTIYDSLTGGSQIGSPLTNSATGVSNGLFMAALDFGNQFPGAARWLEITVRTNGNGAFTLLNPRQPLTPTPYSITAGNLVSGGLASGSYSNAMIFGNSGNSFSGSGTGLMALNASQLTSGTVADARLSANVARLNVNQTFTGQNTFSNNIYGGGVTLMNGGQNPGAFYLRDTNSEAAAFGVAEHNGDYSVDAYAGDVVLRASGPNYRSLLLQAGNGSADIEIVPQNPFYSAEVDIKDYTLMLDGLGVGGQVNISKDLFVTGNAYKPGGGSWSSSSDERLKTNIRSLTGALDKLLELRGVTFEFKDPEKIHELRGERIGMIAQEVEGVFPDWVSTGPDGYKRLTYRGFEALTVEALRELREARKTDLNQLKQQLEETRAENAELKNRLNALERIILRQRSN
jgi:hypothetical protein